MNPALQELQARLGHTFRDPALLETALTHQSYVNQNRKAKQSYQRLEHLGDAVLQLIISEELYKLFPNDREGALSRKRFALVKGSYLCELAREIRVGGCIRLSSHEAAADGANKDSILGDVFESLIGAVFLDSDYNTTKQTVLALYGSLAERLKDFEKSDNPKGQLQEIIHPEHGQAALRYETVRTSGEAHTPEFESHVMLNGRQLGIGRGRSKTLAEEAAARAALATFRTEHSA